MSGDNSYVNIDGPHENPEISAIAKVGDTIEIQPTSVFSTVFGPAKFVGKVISVSDLIRDSHGDHEARTHSMFFKYEITSDENPPKTVDVFEYVVGNTREYTMGGYPVSFVIASSGGRKRSKRSTKRSRGKASKKTGGKRRKTRRY